MGKEYEKWCFISVPALVCTLKQNVRTYMQRCQERIREEVPEL